MDGNDPVREALTARVAEVLESACQSAGPVEIPPSAGVQPPFAPGAHHVPAQPAVQTIGLSIFLPVLLQYAPYVTDAVLRLLNERYGDAVRAFLHAHADQLRALASDRDWQLISELLDIITKATDQPGPAIR